MALTVLFPKILSTLFNSIGGINDALDESEFRDKVTPGAIIPPK